VPDFSISNNADESRFEAHVDGHTGVLDYQMDGDVIALVHTGVPDAIDNRGVGTALVRFALDYAEEHGLRVQPDCVFAEGFIEKNPEYQHLVA
jgi:predicted GNAT family acetyltransferase